MANHLSPSGRSIPIFSDETAIYRPGKSHYAPLHLPCIFSAFEQGSWAEVRRAVTADPSSLTAKHPNLGIYPLDYAFSVLSDTAAVVDHCDRAGVASIGSAQSGRPVTLRERLRRGAHVTLLFVRTYATRMPPPQAPVLHIALQTRLGPLALALLENWPSLATEVASGAKKTPLHSLASSLTAASAPSSWGANSVALADTLFRNGADASVADANGRNALHDLCDAFSSSIPPFGLTRRSRASFSSAAPFLRLIILNGARPCHRDFEGMSPVHMAVSRAIDYTTILRVADEVYQKLVSCAPVVTRVPQKETGYCPKGEISQLPDDCLRKILSECSPRDAVAGIGLTNTYFRSLATSAELWRKSLSYPFTLAHARQRIKAQK